MKQDLSYLRQNYIKGQINFDSLPENPMDLFSIWYNEASENKNILEPNAMSLSTTEQDGFPRSRVVLLKEFNAQGFIFYTNYASQKGIAIEKNPKVGLTFFWLELEQQILIKGTASKVSKETSEEYFYKRPFESQIGAMVSNQSSVIDIHSNLDEFAQNLQNKYENQIVPKPETWGGYLVKPTEFEFWQGRPSRLHDRIRYQLQESKWKQERLSP